MGSPILPAERQWISGMVRSGGVSLLRGAAGVSGRNAVSPTRTRTGLFRRTVARPSRHRWCPDSCCQTGCGRCCPEVRSLPPILSPKSSADGKGCSCTLWHRHDRSSLKWAAFALPTDPGIKGAFAARSQVASWPGLQILQIVRREAPSGPPNCSACHCLLKEKGGHIFALGE